MEVKNALYLGSKNNQNVSELRQNLENKRNIRAAFTLIRASLLSTCSTSQFNLI